MKTKDHISNLLNLKDKVWEIEAYIRNFYPKYYEQCFQHWLPQIITAIKNDTRWLKRGQFSIEDTINSIRDSDNKDQSGIQKFI
jgi:hypothetical protein